MRVFVALNLPKKERERIYRAARPLRDGELPVRWVEPDAFHVTMKFLGEVRQDRIPDVHEALGRVAASTPPFSIRLGGFGAFPTIRKPRVIWLGVGASPELRCLKQDIEWGLSDCGFDAETRAFHPHLTIGRAHPTDHVGVFRGLDEVVAGMEFQGGATVRAIDLMRSHLSKAGARYSVVASVKLTGG
ncbi:MAG TPA: RNA 2',3'-cyclic phosphodiesterase [Longimicrobiales bacterium]|nr:RNA 2',3'-cyclic phosphodiesterase [Longimicrobiales bacterium]